MGGDGRMGWEVVQGWDRSIWENGMRGYAGREEGIACGAFSGMRGSGDPMGCFNWMLRG